MADEFVQKYPMDKDIINDLNPVHWANEAYEISEAFVYDGIRENVKVSQKYVESGKKLAEKQIVIAGNRLANLLKSLNLSD